VTTEIEKQPTGTPERGRWARLLTPWRASFEARVVSLSVLVAVSALTIAFTAYQVQDWQGDRADLAGEATDVGDAIAPLAAVATARHDPELMAMASAQARGEADDQDVAWFPASGGRVQLVSDPKRPRVAPAAVRRTTVRFEGDEPTVWIPYAPGGRYAGQVVIRSRSTAIHGSVTYNSVAALIIGGVATLIAAALARMLARRSLRPLSALDRTSWFPHAWLARMGQFAAESATRLVAKLRPHGAHSWEPSVNSEVQNGSYQARSQRPLWRDAAQSVPRSAKAAPCLESSLAAAQPCRL
jgi:hypothetical protein